MKWLLDLLSGGLVEKITGPLERAWAAKVAAENDKDRLAADIEIQRLESLAKIALAEASDRFSAVRLGRWLIVVPFGLWWAAIFAVQILNPWFGLSLVVIDVPPHIMDMAKILVPAILIADAGAFAGRLFKR